MLFANELYSSNLNNIKIFKLELYSLNKVNNIPIEWFLAKVINFS